MSDQLTGIRAVLQDRTRRGDDRLRYEDETGQVTVFVDNGGAAWSEEVTVTVTPGGLLNETGERDLGYDDALDLLRTMRDEAAAEHRSEEKSTRADGLGYDMKLLGRREALRKAVDALEEARD